MNISVIGFTLPGLHLAQQIRELFLREDSENPVVKVYCGSRRCYELILAEQGRDSASLVECVQSSLQDWVGSQFSTVELLIFVGAAGIAVRGIAPFVKDKKTDPAVLVCDEAGQYVIPILSGHLGGANAYAGMLAQKLRATAVVTTASDVEGKPALDVWAKQQNLLITDRKKIKLLEAALLRGETISILAETPFVKACDSDCLPENIKLFTETEILPWAEQKNKIRIGLYPDKEKTETALWLIPQSLIIGVGCRKGKSFSEIENAVIKLFQERQLPLEAVYALASIDRKAEEIGICELAKAWKLPYLCYSAQELQQVEGTFHPSSFVEQTVGIDNVCERASLRAIMDCKAFTVGRLLVEKQVAGGITLAVALGTRRLTFE